MNRPLLVFALLLLAASFTYNAMARADAERAYAAAAVALKKAEHGGEGIAALRAWQAADAGRKVAARNGAVAICFGVVGCLGLLWAAAPKDTATATPRLV